MTKLKQGSGGRPHDNKAILIMAGTLLLLTGLITTVLVQRTTDPPQNTQGSIVFDAVSMRTSEELMSFYDGLNNGDSWQAITDTIGWPGDCLEEVTTVHGKQQVCMWSNNELSVVAMLLNDQVVSKTKVGF